MKFKIGDRVMINWDGIAQTFGIDASYLRLHKHIQTVFTVSIAHSDWVYLEGEFLTFDTNLLKKVLPTPEWEI